MTDLRDLGVAYLKGLCMGAADAVPGVSGGTIALVVGIYERLIGALTAIDATAVRAVLARAVRVDAAGAWRALRTFDGQFLLALGFGIATAVVAVTSTVAVAARDFPVPTFGFFLGLIAASAYVLRGDVQLDTPRRYGAALAGFALAFLASGEAGTALGHSPVVVFLAGVVAVSAMILPGISGSLILLILGQYEYLAGTVRTLRDAVLAVPTGGPVGAAAGPGIVAVVFVAGALVGLFTVAHVVRWALAAYRRATLAFLVALVVGALRAPVDRIDRAVAASGAGWSGEVVGVVAATAAVGAVLVLALERYAGVVTLDDAAAEGEGDLDRA
jgi:putative membrane protein